MTSSPSRVLYATDLRLGCLILEDRPRTFFEPRFFLQNLTQDTDINALYTSSAMPTRTRASTGAQSDPATPKKGGATKQTKRKSRHDEGHTDDKENHAPASKKSKSDQENGKTHSRPSSAKKRKVKSEDDDEDVAVKSEDVAVKAEDDDEMLSNIQKDMSDKFARSKAKGEAPADIAMKDPASLLKDRKLRAYAATANQSPFPDFKHPTPEEAKLAHKILSDIHGKKVRPKTVVASKDRAGCGDSPSVLDALVRTILSQNTSDKNSTRAKRSMDATYDGSDNWDAIMKGGQAKLQESIKCGGLSQTKSRVILSILEQAKEKYGSYSLDHLFQASNEDAMAELIGFQGVGPKTASCVLLFCLQRESFAVDTHVHRITGLLGWRPARASRDETHAHLDVRIPDEDKYGLHILLVQHGKVCDECKAGGRNAGKCELRKAFRQKVKGEESVKVEDTVKDEAPSDEEE